MGTGKIGATEVDSPGERPSVEEKVKKEPRLQLRFLPETTILKPHQPAPQREGAEKQVSSEEMFSDGYSPHVRHGKKPRWKKRLRT